MRLVYAAFVAVLLVGCGGNKSGSSADGSIPVGDGGTGDSGSANGPDAACGPNGNACTSGDQCCTGTCDPQLHVCALNGTCNGAGAKCSSPTDCCTQSCVNGTCSTATCQSTGATCTANSDCCSNTCNGTCQTVPGTFCTTLGNSCTTGGECCSTFCDSSGKCAEAGGTGSCSATGDICFHDGDCCSGLCTIQSGASAGTCTALKSGGCTIDGEPCANSSNCCSAVCAPVAGGGSVCETASGCRVKGDVCREDKDCCGGAGNGLPSSTGSGLVTCQIVAGTDPPIGTCSTPSGGGTCDPEGDICGQGGQSARENCCDCAPPKYDCCKPDPSGIFRCYGSPAGGNCPNGYDGTANCCIAQGDICTFSSECCDGAKCTPDSSGTLRCGATTCVPDGGVCTSTADCCAGTMCNLPPGALSGTCGQPPTTADAGVGTPDAGVCAVFGQACTTGADCCSGYICTNLSGTTCGSSDTGCTCETTIP